MLRKILLSTLAAGALMATVVVPTQASPHHRHGRHHRQHRAHYRTWGHREFCSWGEANAWIAFQPKCLSGKS